VKDANIAIIALSRFPNAKPSLQSLAFFVFAPCLFQGLQSEFDPEKELIDELKPLVTAAVNANPDSKTSLLMKDKMSKVNTLAADTQSLYDERLKALELALDAGDKFWTGLDEIKHILKDVQDHLDSEEPPAVELDVLEEQMHDHQVRTLAQLFNLRTQSLNFTPDC